MANLDLIAMNVVTVAASLGGGALLALPAVVAVAVLRRLGRRRTQP